MLDSTFQFSRPRSEKLGHLSPERHRRFISPTTVVSLICVQSGLKSRSSGEMVRSVKSHREEEEDEDEEFVSRTTDASSEKAKEDGKSTGQKGNAFRSKHSETEQRRRCKINERFQMLRDLLPQNDQKRDKASFLLEVIQYIQFLQEKLQFYEGPCQGWTQEPSKLTPWKSSCAPVESFMDPSQLVRNGSGQEDNIVVTPAMLTNVHNSVESDLGEPAAYDAMDQPSLASNQAFPTHLPLKSSVIEDLPTQPGQTSVSDSGQLASQSQSQFWQVRQSTTESTVPCYARSEQEELKVGSAEASFSNAYSQGLLNTLTQALQSSGVDLSQASISVQLDVGKQANTEPIPTFSEKDPQNQSPGHQSRAIYGAGSSYNDSGQPNKRLRTERMA